MKNKLTSWSQRTDNRWHSLVFTEDVTQRSAGGVDRVSYADNKAVRRVRLVVLSFFFSGNLDANALARLFNRVSANIVILYSSSGEYHGACWTEVRFWNNKCYCNGQLWKIEFRCHGSCCIVDFRIMESEGFYHNHWIFFHFFQSRHFVNSLVRLTLYYLHPHCGQPRSLFGAIVSLCHFPPDQ